MAELQLPHSPQNRYRQLSFHLKRFLEQAATTPNGDAPAAKELPAALLGAIKPPVYPSVI